MIRRRLDEPTGRHPTFDRSLLDYAKRRTQPACKTVASVLSRIERLKHITAPLRPILLR
jgi:hypothetical protein